MSSAPGKKMCKADVSFVAAVVLVLGYFLALVAGVLFLPVDWDEGWNMTVARSLVELGHYGRLIEGEPTNASLSNGWPAVLPAALGFKLFGVHYLAARAVAGAENHLLLIVFWLLVRRLWGRKHACLVLGTLIFVGSDWRVVPMLAGAKVWGETGLLLACILGYYCMSFAISARRGGLLLTILAGVLFGLALHAKPQLRPFLSIALITPGAILFGQRRAAIGFRFLLSLAVAYLIHRNWWPPLPALPMKALPDPVGILERVALVTDPVVRLRVIKYSVLLAWPTLLSLGWMTFRLLRRGFAAFGVRKPDLATVALSLFLLSSSWVAWFLLLSIDFPRYLFPPLYIGSMFLSCFLVFVFEKRSLFEVFKTRFWRICPPLPRAMFFALVVLLIIHATVSLVDMITTVSVLRHDNEDLRATVQFLNARTETDAVIESYDTSLFFLLDRRYSYPPDQAQIDLIGSGPNDPPSESLRSFLSKPRCVNYVVIGDWTRWVFRIYSQELIDRCFEKIESFGRFNIYRVTSTDSIACAGNPTNCRSPENHTRLVIGAGRFIESSWNVSPPSR